MRISLISTHFKGSVLKYKSNWGETGLLRETTENRKRFNSVHEIRITRKYLKHCALNYSQKGQHFFCVIFGILANMFFVHAMTLDATSVQDSFHILDIRRRTISRSVMSACECYFAGGLRWASSARKLSA
jgi:hypothetical protein